MELDSRGPACNLPIRYLKDWLPKRGYRALADRLEEDAHYGATAVEGMRLYQAWASLEMDGGFGPATRTTMREDGYDFVADAKALETTEVTVFIQPDGQYRQYWRPGEKPWIKPSGN
ncbi:hypothetical protein KGO04_02475 [Patescibacteria group bacterium]|nr:hypothetical protein [Patescibacteria group bacterium]MDE1943896.1 hypothetical protein [Patescibacteria group bacterium]